MHVALLCEEKKPSKCSKFNHSFFMTDFKRLIDADHEGEKLRYSEDLATNCFVHRLANRYDNEIDIRNINKKIGNIVKVRQIRNNFFKRTFLPINEKTNLTLLKVS